MNASTRTSPSTSPCGHRDPHWTLWLEVWNRSREADDTARARQAAIEGAWHRDLVALLAEGGSRGEFRRVDAERYATRLRALLDGFSVHVAVGLPGTGRDQVLERVGEFIEESLTVAALTSPTRERNVRKYARSLRPAPLLGSRRFGHGGQPWDESSGRKSGSAR